MAKLKRKKVIKRVYEKGRETTVLFAKKKRRKLIPSRKAIEQFVKIKQDIAIPRLTKQVAIQRPLVDNYELPSQYGTTVLKLMVKDPFWIYAYWEIAPDSLESLKNQLTPEEIEQAKMVLRMYDITLIDFNGNNANHYFDIEVGFHTNNWYVNLLSDSVSYVGEIGLRILDGRFFVIARSNYVHTPRMSYSPRTEQIWMKVTDEIHKPPYVMPIIKNLQADPSSVLSPAPVRKERIKIDITDEDLKRYYAEISPLLRDIISPRLDRQYGGENSKYTFIIEGDTEEERRKIIDRLPKDYFIKSILLGSSQNLVVLGASEHLVKGPGGASEFVQEKIRQHQFFFELATELIVYGRTESDAELWLGNKKIQLRKDGTFSLRFALPDGNIPLEFKAISHDKKKSRKISTYVERKTHYED